MTDTPNIKIPLVPENTLNPAAGLNLSLIDLDALVQTAVISMSLTEPPMTSSDGDLYIVASPATGDWAGHEGDLARYHDDGNYWEFYEAGEQIHYVLNRADGFIYYYDENESPSTWQQITGGGAGSVVVQDDDSPPTTAGDASVIIFGAGLYVEEIDDGVFHVVAPGGISGSGESNVTPDSHPLIPDDADDEFESGSSIDTTGARRTGATPWAWINQGGSATDSVNADQGCLQIDAGSGSDAMRIVAQAAPTTPWRYRSKFTVRSTANFGHAGMTIYNSGNGRVMSIDMQFNNAARNIVVLKYSDVNTFSSAASTTDIAGSVVFGQTRPFYWEIENDGTNIAFRISTSGYDGTFVTVFTETSATYIGAVTHIGLSTNPGGSASPSRLTADWFRRMA